MMAMAGLPSSTQDCQQSCRLNTTSSRHPLKRERYALAYAHAHRRQPELSIARFESTHRGSGQARARHSERMTEGNRTAMRIDVFGLVGQSELTQDRERLRGKRFIQFDHVEIADLE